ncbi:hypothetical protein IscW_ISCW013020 [Ixodes scapularis]|uniref:Uncharacterized protein n=1 Tax=Ixodes scapularis TaxID=6945 RepID=B7QBZ8_IXOSC|nr:hypothetical protein IscW_ISCW013020 [Ixodes scapularis]|eukprot:XP_002413062.1 hypothetical protein IscW_ISCW013020 [Ixodes scapularis]
MGKDFVAIFLQPTENKCYQVFVYSNEVVRAQKFPYLRAHRKPLDSTKLPMLKLVPMITPNAGKG